MALPHGSINYTLMCNCDISCANSLFTAFTQERLMIATSTESDEMCHSLATRVLYVCQSTCLVMTSPCEQNNVCVLTMAVSRYKFCHL